MKVRNYLAFGIMSTALNFLLYFVFTRFAGLGTVFSSVLTWVLVVFFVYVTNRKWVFGSTKTTKRDILTEMSMFYSCRFLTGALDWCIMFVFADVLHFWDLAVKVFSICVVVVLNFLASEKIVFAQK